jgi:HEAT repeat protein
LAETGKFPARQAALLEELLLSVFRRPHEPPAVRGGALASAGYFSTPAVHAAITDGHADVDLRESAVRAMGHNCDPRWTATLLRDTERESASIRAAAARSIGEIEDARGVPRLIELLEDPTVAVRLAAIWALSEIGGEEAQEALIYCLDDPQEPIREAAEAALNEMAERDDILSL